MSYCNAQYYASAICCRVQGNVCKFVSKYYSTFSPKTACADCNERLFTERHGHRKILMLYVSHTSVLCPHWSAFGSNINPRLLDMRTFQIPAGNYTIGLWTLYKDIAICTISKMCQMLKFALCESVWIWEKTGVTCCLPQLRYYFSMLLRFDTRGFSWRDCWL
jgi:hypothetical protein